MHKYKIIVASFFFVSLSLLAQESEIADKGKLKKGLLERMVQPKVSLDSSYLSDADVKDAAGGSVAVTKNRIQLNNAIGGISYTNWSFLWNNVAGLPFGNGVDAPIKQMHSLKLNANIPYFINENWFLLTSLSLNTTFEKEMKDSYGAGIFTFASYKIDEEHSIQMGAFANYHPVSTLALPVISYSYRARQTDGFQVVLGFPRAYVGYFINDATLVRGGMIFSQSVIKLSDESVVEKSGYIEAKDYMSNFGLTYELTPSFTIDADILYSLKRDFIIYNSAGDEQQSYSIDPSFGLNLRLRYLF